MNGRTNSNNTVDSELVQLPLDPPSDVNGEPYSGRVELTWTDAKDKYATPEGEVAASPQLMAAKWDRTVVVRKPNTDPNTLADGTTIVSSDVRNQYQSTPYIDTSVTDGTEYHYGFFSVTDRDIVSAPAIIIATPKSGTLLREVPNNTVITITENGVPAEFIVATHDYEAARNGTGRVLCVRANHITEDGTITVDIDKTYENGPYAEYLTTIYLARLSEVVQNWIGSTQIQCTTYDSGISAHYNQYYVAQNVFTLSAMELDSTTRDPDYNGYGVPPISYEGIFIDGLLDFIKNNYPLSIETYSLLRSYRKFYHLDGDLISHQATGATFGHSIMGVTMYARTEGYPWPSFTLPDTCRINENNILIEE